MLLLALALTPAPAPRVQLKSPVPAVSRTTGLPAPGIGLPAAPALAAPAAAPALSAAAEAAPPPAPVPPAPFPRVTPQGRKVATVPGFGTPEGFGVSNPEAVMKKVDGLFDGKPAALEAVLVEPLPMLKFWKAWGTGTNPYSHLMVFYTMPDGERKAVNIVGKKGRKLVNFMKPEDYLFSTKEFGRGSEQGGLYNRAMTGVRIEKLPAETIEAVDRYYRELVGRNEAGAARFNLAWGRVLNFVAKLRKKAVEWGNCGWWSSSALAAGKIIPDAEMWPKLVWIELYETYRKLDPANVHVVQYRKILHAVRSYGVTATVPALVAPFRWLKTARYWNLEKYADAIVEVRAPGAEATAYRVSPTKR